jgi:hypothetical protein
VTEMSGRAVAVMLTVHLVYDSAEDPAPPDRQVGHRDLNVLITVQSPQVPAAVLAVLVACAA